MREGIRCISCLPSRTGKCLNTTSQVDSSEVPDDGSRGSPTAQHSPDAHDSSASTNLPTDVIPSSLLFERPRKRIIRRIPRASRELAAKKFSSLLDTVVANNDTTSWSRLLCFAQRCLQAPIRGRRRVSFATSVNKQLRGDVPTPSPSAAFAPRPRRKTTKPKDPLESLAQKVSVKIEEGNLNGAVRLACSEELIADVSEDTFNALRAKHPGPHPDSAIPIPSSESELTDELMVSVPGVAYAIRSFRPGSAGGPDGLTPQHLKDMTGKPAGEGGSILLTAITSFVAFVLRGEVLEEVRPILFGANLVALRKKAGGVRPIAVGCTLRRLAAKYASMQVREQMGEFLQPIQLGYGVKLGAEAAVHAARRFLGSLPSDQLLLKLDFANAFNTLRRDKMLRAVGEIVPSLFPFVYSSYCSPSSLFWEDKVLDSAEGVQQGDPLGPLLFCLTIHNLTTQLVSDFKIFYLDDGTLGGACDDVLRDLSMVEDVAGQLGLQLNREKSEVVCCDPHMLRSFLSAAPGFHVTSPEDVTLLGSPLSDSVDDCILEKVQTLKILEDRIQRFQLQDALLLLRYSLAAPRMIYLLRTSPCFSSPSLYTFDELLRRILSSICNMPIATMDKLWMQASLPVRYGGLGLRSVVQLAPSAFLSSVNATYDLVDRLLPLGVRPVPYVEMEAALTAWSRGHSQAPLSAPASFSQKAWDTPVVKAVVDHLLESSSDERSRARLLSSTCKESGAWLNALPLSQCGLRMDNETVRLAVGLRLGAPLCYPHQCRHCNNEVDELATHGLSCRWSEGRLPRHAAINDIVCRSLVAAKVPSRLEPNGLYRSDGKRPDGISLAPWKNGKCLIWDATCPDTYAPSHLAVAAGGAGEVAEQAEQAKCHKYSALESKFFFVPIAIETSGVFGPSAYTFLKELGSRLMSVTMDSQARHYLFQRISVAVQRGNAASVLGTLIKDSEDLDCYI